MQRDDCESVQLGKLHRGPVALGGGLGQEGANFTKFGAAGGDGLREAFDPRRRVFVLALQRPTLGEALCPIALQLLVKLPDDFLDDIRREQMVAHRAEHAPFEHVVCDRAAVGAGAAFAVGGAAPLIAADDRDPAAADPADQQAGKEAFRAPALIGPETSQPIKTGLDGRPGGGIDDPQLWRLLYFPLGRRVWPCDALPGDGIALEALAIVDDAAGVQFVVEDAVAARPAAVDRRGVPAAAGGGSDAFGIEALRDRARAPAGKKLGEDAANDRGLVLEDAPPAALDRAARVGGEIDGVAVAQAARYAAGDDAADLAPPGLFPQLLQEKRGHGAFQTDMDFPDLALGERHQSHAGEAQALVDGGDILLIAADPVQRLGQDHVRLVELVKQRVEAGPVAGGARQSEIGEDVDDAPALFLRALPAQPGLIFSRRFGLAVARVSGVDRNACHRDSRHGGAGQFPRAPSRAQGRVQIPAAPAR